VWGFRFFSKALSRSGGRGKGEGEEAVLRSLRRGEGRVGRGYSENALGEDEGRRGKGGGIGRSVSPVSVVGGGHKRGNGESIGTASERKLWERGLHGVPPHGD